MWGRGTGEVLDADEVFYIGEVCVVERNHGVCVANGKLVW